MTSWTEISTPAEITGFARDRLEAYEAENGRLSDWLPQTSVNSSYLSFNLGEYGEDQIADFRAWDAEPTIGDPHGYKRMTFELAPISRKMVISEKLRHEAAQNDSQMLHALLGTTDKLSRAISNRMELLRMMVLEHAKLIIPELGVDVDFERNEKHTVTAANLWTDTSVSRLDDIQRWIDIYTETTGAAPGAMVMGSKTQRLLLNGDEFRPQMLNGVSRPTTPADGAAILAAHGFPNIHLYTRRLQGKLILPEDKILFLPAPGENQMGATFYGQTVSAAHPMFQLGPAEQAGIVVSVQEATSLPMTVTLEADGQALPALVNPDLSMVATVA